MGGHRTTQPEVGIEIWQRGAKFDADQLTLSSIVIQPSACSATCFQAASYPSTVLTQYSVCAYELVYPLRQVHWQQDINVKQGIPAFWFDRQPSQPRELVTCCLNAFC